MSERNDLLASIATTIKDYRAGEIAEPSPDHVDRWVKQFSENVQVPLLREVDHVFQNTYFSRNDISKFFADQIKHKGLAGIKPCAFWKAANFLDIQQHGHSQTEICELFSTALKKQCGSTLEDCGEPGGAFIYLDDVLFTGGRIGADLKKWITRQAPSSATVHIVVIAAHSLGEWQCMEALRKAAEEAGKKIIFHCWASARFENRKAYRHRSEVLWPAAIPDDAALNAYMTQEDRFPFELRKTGGKTEHKIFSSEEGRQLLESELLMAGMRIRGFCQNPSRAMRPLGFSAFGLGFGSMIATFRNCPNNCPLALWWGDPGASSGPLKQWYPLLARKTYE